MPKCSYCGNTSGKRDSFGGCISCGAQLQELPFAQIDTRQSAFGITGSISIYYANQVDFDEQTSALRRTFLEEPILQWTKFQ